MNNDPNNNTNSDYVSHYDRTFVFLNDKNTIFRFPDGNVYEILSKHCSYGDTLYYHVALKNIKPGCRTLQLHRPLPESGIEVLVEGIDLDETDANITTIELVNYSDYLGYKKSLPSNFIRDKSKLPALKKIVAVSSDGQKFVVKTFDNDRVVPYAVYHDNILYTVKNETEHTLMTRCGYSFDGPNSRLKGDLTLPEKIYDCGREYTLQGIGYWSFREADITSLILPKSVKRIGEYAFAFCSSLKKVSVMADGLEVLAEGAFWSCENLEEIDLPDSVTTIEQKALCCGSCLGDVRLPRSLRKIGTDAIYCRSVTLKANCNPSVIEQLSLGSVYTYEYRVDPDCHSYVSVDGVLYSADMKTLLAYPRKKKDTTLTVPPSVTSIAKRAIPYVEALNEIRIPSSITTLPECLKDDLYAFPRYKISVY